MDISLSSSPGSACCPLSVSGMRLWWSWVQLVSSVGDREKSNSHSSHHSQLMAHLWDNTRVVLMSFSGLVLITGIKNVGAVDLISSL